MNNIQLHHLNTDERARSALWVRYSGIRCEGGVEKTKYEEGEGSVYRYHAETCDF